MFEDIHCHILPGVDDGAVDIDMSLAMVEAAKASGVSKIVCTPHCRNPWFDYDAMMASFDELSEQVDLDMAMGFEVYQPKLRELGEGFVERLSFQDGSERFLLELETDSSGYDLGEYGRTITMIQSHGLNVVIAHPERYKAIQKDIGFADSLVRMGCALQLSADYSRRGILSPEMRCAKRLMREGMYSYLASDAHRPEHYAQLSKAMRAFDNNSR